MMGAVLDVAAAAAVVCFAAVIVYELYVYFSHDTAWRLVEAVAVVVVLLAVVRVVLFLEL